MNILSISHAYYQNETNTHLLSNNVHFNRKINLNNSNNISNNNLLNIIRDMHNCKLNDEEASKLSAMLMSVCEDVRITNDLRVFNIIISNYRNRFKDKFKVSNRIPVVAMVMPKKEFEDCAKILNINPDKYYGYIIAVGEKNIPVQQWTNAYTSTLIIFEKPAK